MTSVKLVILILAVFAIGLLVFLICISSPYYRNWFHKKEVPAVSTVPKTYMQPAFLLQKIDERRRIIDEFRHTKICDEYFELVFELRNGETICISCSKTVYREIPFRKTGILTYSDGRLIQFITQEQVISDEYIRSGM